MAKTFTCKELGGICDEGISGDTFEEILQKGMRHMQADAAHAQKMMRMPEDSKETKAQWFARMQHEFDLRAEDQV